MSNTFSDLIQQSYSFPQRGFELIAGQLHFHGVSLKKLIDKYGTPFQLTYLPKITSQITNTRVLFKKAFEQLNYTGKYHYAYCTKCNHLYPIIKEALKNNVHLETSSSLDIELIINLLEKGQLNKSNTILHNGFKTDAYIKQIIGLQKKGFHNTITILDSTVELSRLAQTKTVDKLKIGIRMAISQEEKSPFYTSRLGIPSSEILPFYRKKIKNNPAFELKMFHFFIDAGIQDNSYYWGEFQKALDLFIQLKKENPALDSFNIGGGFPIPNHLEFEYDYEAIIYKIVERIKNTCKKEQVEEPDIYTEFGKYTVGESSAVIFEVLETKKQNDIETWYIIDNSLLNTIPDAWTLQEKFILLPINKWNNNYSRVNIGGISCDHTDYYNSSEMNQEIILPIIDQTSQEPLYLGFFHTGAYQDAVSGYGGVKHCLIPSPKHIVIEPNKEGRLESWLFRSEQASKDALGLLGY